MAVVTAAGQFTVVDYNDAKSFYLNLVPLKGLTQLLDSKNTDAVGDDTYINGSDWTAEEFQAIKAELYLSGGGGTNKISDNAITAITWTLDLDGVSQTLPAVTFASGAYTATATYDYALSGIAVTGSQTITGNKMPQVFRIKSNILNTTLTTKQAVITCTITYLDPDTNSPLTIKGQIVLNKTIATDSSFLLDLNFSTSQFLNASVPSTAVVCKFFAGTTDVTANTAFTWTLGTGTANPTKPADGTLGSAGGNTIATIDRSHVDTSRTFTVTALYQTKTTTKTFTIFDQSDQWQIEMSGSSDKLPKGSTLNLTATLFKNGQKVTLPAGATVAWFKLVGSTYYLMQGANGNYSISGASVAYTIATANGDGSALTSWANTGVNQTSTTLLTIAVNDPMVVTMGTFICYIQNLQSDGL